MSVYLAKQLFVLYPHGIFVRDSLDGDMVAPDAALAVEKGGGKDPFVVVLDLLEEFDAADSRHLVAPGGSVSEPPP